jgi:CelD/BcsL family acetyltransferase involved in cellulose biosynthesis
MVLTEDRDFASLEEEWGELYEHIPSATPFQSWAWLYSWWEVYGEGYQLRLIIVRDGDLLVGLLPLMARRGRLLLIGDLVGGGLSTPYKDLLAREGWEERVARAAARALRELGGWWVADLRELLPQAAVWDLFQVWDGPRLSMPITANLFTRASSWEELLASLSAKARKSARSTLRRLEKDGVRYEPAGPGDDAERAARRLVALHRELWQGRRIEADILTPRYEAFMVAAARRTTARGIGRISEFWRDDSVIISQFLLFDKNFVDTYVIGASREASRRYQFNTLGNWDAMNVVRGRSVPYVSFGDPAGDKVRWGDEVVPSHRAILARNWTFWILYAAYHAMRRGYHALRSEAQLYAHSEAAPRWLKKATDRYYALQSYVYSEDAPRWLKKATEGYWALRSKYGYGWLRYKYELARARQETRRSTNASRRKG